MKRDGTYERALIILLSDHGEGLGDHGEAEHGILLYREALHVPLLVKLPGARRAGTVLGQPVGLADLLPTIARLVGIEPPARQDGHDLFQPAANAAGIYSETYYPRIHLGWSELRSLIDARYHFIDGPKPELYDIAGDPGEKRPLSDGERVSTAMKRTLDARTGAFNEAAEVDPEAAERLRSLGYLVGGVGPPGSGPATSLANPRDEIATHEAIKTLVREGRDEEAVAGFRRLLAGSPGLFDAQWELGVTLMRLGRPEEAVPEFEKAMRLSPALAPNVALALAEAQLQLGRLDAAEATAKVALAANAARAHALLARVALARHDAAGVEREAALATGDLAAEQGALMTRADLLVQQGRLPEALALLDAARQARIAAGGRPFRGLDGRRGDILARLRRYDEAAAALREEIANYPANAQAYANLAVVSAVMRRPAPEVFGILEAMYRANPTRRSALLAAEALDYMGKPQLAQEWRRRAAGPAGGSR